MKKFKKLIMALILGLFCGIGLIFGNSIVKANPLENYEVIERVNYIDDNWEFSPFPFTINDNWNEYGLKFNVSLGDLSLNGIGYLSSVYVINDNFFYYSLVIPTDFYNIDVIIFDAYSGNIHISQIYSARLISENSITPVPLDLVGGYIDLIKCVPNVNSSYQKGYDEGYNTAKEEVLISSPLLNCQISVYDSDNMLLGSEPINNNLISADSRLPSGVLYSYATDYLNSGESGRIEIDFSIAITPNDRLQESINFTNGSYISEMFTSYNWVSSNRFIVEQNLVNASKIVKDINLIPNLAMVSFTFNNVDNLEFFEYGITSSYYDSIYNNGYDVGYDVGYDIGFNQSSEENFDLGYQAGYNAGLESEFSFGSELLKVASIPFNVLGQILSFEIFDVNVWLLLCGILTICVVIWVIKKFRG